MMDKMVIKRTRRVGDLDRIKKELDHLNSLVQKEVDRRKPLFQSTSKYISKQLVPRLNTYIPQYNQLVKDLTYTYLIENRPISFLCNEEVDLVIALSSSLCILFSHCKYYGVPLMVDFHEYLVSIRATNGQADYQEGRADSGPSAI